MSTSAAVRETMTPSERLVYDLVSDSEALVSPPDVCLRVNQLAADEASSIDAVAAVIVRDPNLTARMLKIANSAYYGAVSRVDTVARAATLLGMAEIQKLVCTLCAVENFSRLSSTVTNMNTFWRHAVYTGFLAQALARRAHVLQPERLFVAGILHDLGTLLINRRFPEVAERTISDALGDEDRLYALEGQELGFDHAQLGGLMLAGWHLPPALVDTVRWHHQPHRARQAPLDAAIVKVADTIANYSTTGSHSEQAAEEDTCDARLLQRFGVNIACSNDELMDEVDHEFVETLYLLLG
ncbi:MAG: HDOD domain-containing protein [Gammaproteobacteria bacterium]